MGSLAILTSCPFDTACYFMYIVGWMYFVQLQRLCPLGEFIPHYCLLGCDP